MLIISFAKGGIGIIGNNDKEYSKKTFKKN